jgi:UDP-glucose 4-epimerase
MKKELNVLVTGAAGLQGRHLVQELLAQPNVAEVVGIDDLSRPFLDDPVEWARGVDGKFTLEPRKYQTLTTKELAQFDSIIHLAAFISVPQSMESDEMQRAYWENNASSMLELMIKLRNTPNKPVLVYASTSETFGNPIKTPMPPDHPQNPQSIYAASKLAAEKILHAHAVWNHYPAVSVRTFNTYGPNQNSSYSDAAVIALFIRQALRGGPLTVHGDGHQTRDFQYAADAVKVYRILALAGTEQGYPFRAAQYNTGTGVQTRIIDLADTIRSLIDPGLEILHTDPRSGDLEALEADYTQIKKDTGWEPRVKLEEGLEHTINWYRAFLPKDTTPDTQRPRSIDNILR